MWRDEQELSGAMKSEVDGPAPAVRTDLADVLKRGRRRLLARRASATAGVLAVVGLVGFGAAALGDLAAPHSPPAAGNSDGPVVTTSPAPVGPEWIVVDRPARTPYATFTPAWTAPPPPGREILAIPQCDLGTEGRFTTWLAPRPGEPLMNAWASAVAQVASPAQVSGPHTRVIRANKAKRPDQVDAHDQWVDVTDGDGTGSVALRLGRTTAAGPVAAADDELFAEGNCAPPRRLVRSDGTVLQYYAARASEPFQSLTQGLRVYTPSGATYAITLRNFGSPDFRFREEDSSFDRTGAGRATLPLTEEQLTRIGLAVADAG